MKPILTALILALAAGPALAQSVDISSVFPPSTYPDSTSETVTQDEAVVEN